MPSRFTGNYEKAPRNRDSIFDRKLQQFRTTGEIVKTTKSIQEVKKGITSHYEYPSMDSKSVNDHRISELERMAFIDPLTGGLNERTILNTLKDEIRRAERYKQSLGLLILEIDEFDRLTGEAPAFAVENLIRSVATLLQKNIREVDLLGRIDGGTFALICPETSIGELCVMGDRLRNQFASSRIASIGYTLSVTISGGVSSYPQTGANAEEIFSAAGEALAIALRQGGNNIAEPSSVSKQAVTYGNFSVSNEEEPFHRDTVDFSPVADDKEGAALLAALTTEVDTKQTAEYVKPNPSMLKPTGVVTPAVPAATEAIGTS